MRQDIVALFRQLTYGVYIIGAAHGERRTLREPVKGKSGLHSRCTRAFRGSSGRTCSAQG